MKTSMQEFRKKNADELRKELVAKREELRVFSFGMQGSKTRNTKLGRVLRKDVARILFLLSSEHAQ